MIGTALKAAAVLLVCLVIADIIGVLACTFFDIMPLRASSGILPYAIWLVLGIFCGLFAYNVAGAWASPAGEGDWSARPSAARIGTVVVTTGAVVLIALSALFHLIYWSRGVAGEYYVPDSASHSLVFFGAVLAAMIMGRFLLMPAPTHAAPGSRRAA